MLIVKVIDMATEIYPRCNQNAPLRSDSCSNCECLSVYCKEKGSVNRNNGRNLIRILWTLLYEMVSSKKLSLTKFIHYATSHLTHCTIATKGLFEPIVEHMCSEHLDGAHCRHQQRWGIATATGSGRYIGKLRKVK